MFPGITVSVTGLDEKTKYTVSLEVHSADGDRYKFVNGNWIVAGKGDAHNTNMMKYVHPDSPATGKQWMGAPISFKKLKLTNNKKSKKDYVSIPTLIVYVWGDVYVSCCNFKTGQVCLYNTLHDNKHLLTYQHLCLVVSFTLHR